MKIDIREPSQKVSEIVFGGKTEFASSLIKGRDSSSAYIVARNKEGITWRRVSISDRMDAENLLAALEHALNLGWFDN
ncbi:hypothetical protein 20Sep418_00195 [Pseudomonas phage 20Sep418]|uniref:Uncharacterized protein n=9 Tax=Pakpunavirus TaxID=1921407 RepID=A0A1J0MEA7_9CAUD|nr:hypothetical protein PJG4_097 [Pseudomonas phage JG004]YP_008857079.1 hypothetical protein X831_gp039 [Pseudomonas phage PAK_P2]YP_009186977.1 hypothetical protein AU075_gp133 [Pseudomonas phage C11]YP_009598138.1 hypothetical protein FDH21_gp132 [Pseudomonas phage Zigelbrucke]YP_010762525.1 hypothetical protein QE325_gp048 [Pseudomonas phage pPA-3099-2aT.2]YP_010762761.1 hypothetical protein QE326_gp086 [Pseudomonas phage PaZq-1]YP_010762979.1 hypothetical protein QE327_gp135 [Pseudomonas